MIKKYNIIDWNIRTLIVQWNQPTTPLIWDCSFPYLHLKCVLHYLILSIDVLIVPTHDELPARP